MEAKLLEIRDAGTFIPALAVSISCEDGYLARRAGFGLTRCVQLTHFSTGRAYYESSDWGDRTMQFAHEYIERHWNELRDHDVVDVQFMGLIYMSPSNKT